MLYPILKSNLPLSVSPFSVLLHMKEQKLKRKSKAINIFLFIGSHKRLITFAYSLTLFNMPKLVVASKHRNYSVLIFFIANGNWSQISHIRQE